MTDPIRIETEDHHIHIIPKVQEEPPKKDTPYFALFIGLIMIAVALNLWHVQHRAAIQTHQPVVQGSAE